VRDVQTIQKFKVIHVMNEKRIVRYVNQSVYFRHTFVNRLLMFAFVSARKKI
jgi:hypothetical protein